MGFCHLRHGGYGLRATSPSKDLTSVTMQYLLREVHIG